MKKSTGLKKKIYNFSHFMTKLYIKLFGFDVRNTYNVSFGRP